MPESSPYVIIEEVLKMNNSDRRLKKESTLANELLRHGYAEVYDLINDCTVWMSPKQFDIYTAKNKKYTDYTVLNYYPWRR